MRQGTPSLPHNLHHYPPLLVYMSLQLSIQRPAQPLLQHTGPLRLTCVFKDPAADYHRYRQLAVVHSVTVRSRKRVGNWGAFKVSQCGGHTKSDLSCVHHHGFDAQLFATRKCILQWHRAHPVILTHQNSVTGHCGPDGPRVSVGDAHCTWSNELSDAHPLCVLSSRQW